MSVTRRTWTWFRPSLPTSRVLALLATAGLLASVLSVLYAIVEVDGDPTTLLVLAGVSLLAATAFARVVRVVVALALAAVVLSVGLVWYLLSLPYDPHVVDIVESNLELLSGQSLLEIKRSTIWALSVTPTPVFVTWYLSVRGWYTTATLVGGATLGYFVLTGDATVMQTLLGVISGAALLGFGDLDSRETSFGATESVVIVLAVMIVAPLLVTVAPAGAASSLSFGGEGGGGGDTVEASLINTDSKVDIAGDISLSPKIRYTVTSPESRYWRVASFDRYTGSGWIRTGDAAPYGERGLQFPGGPSRRIEQTYEVESATTAMPAAWRPVEVSGPLTNRTEVTTIGGLQPSGRLQPGDRYRVTSAIPVVSPTELANAGSDDPPAIEEKYTQLPSSTPDRVAERTATLTANADNRYETARTVEQWLKENREYSLDVDKPEGNVADAFLFEMERGYCTYYATTMVVMLRSQDIPARMTVGYTTGEQVDPDSYVVRGYNSHAWVEVYFPERGWVRFDPTPPGPRVEAEQASLDEARANDVPNVDTNETRQQTPTPSIGPSTPTPASTPTPSDSSTNATNAAQSLQGNIPGSDGGGSGVPELPSREELALGAVVLAGAIAGVRRSGVGERAYRAVWMRYLPRSDPEADVERAFERMTYLLERRHRPRRESETVRQYLDAVGAGGRSRRVARLYERARYGGEVTEEMADEAVDLVERLRREG